MTHTNERWAANAAALIAVLIAGTAATLAGALPHGQLDGVFTPTDTGAQQNAAVPEEVRLAGDRLAGSDCPAGYICGQNPTYNNTHTVWMYSDLGFSNGALTGRVTSEQFPPPGVPALTQPIYVVSWRGVYLDDHGQQCTKAHSFRIEFYNDDGTGKPDCANPVASFQHVVPEIASPGAIACIGFAPCVPVTRFVARLPVPVSLPSGHFSIVSDTIDPDCFFFPVPAAAGEGNGLLWRWYEQPTPCNFQPPSGASGDIAYCFQSVVTGACCFDCTGTCTDSDDFECGLLGGRFQPGMTCAQVDPPCGTALGACCSDDGACALTTCAECVTPPEACCLGTICEMLTPLECNQRAGVSKGPGSTCWLNCCGCTYCLGDLNCSGNINFKDINPFVLRLSNPSGYAAQFPACPDKNGDINCDGTISFKDINPFVALLSTNPIPTCPYICAAPAPRTQGSYWAGPGTSCEPNSCCTVVAGTPKELEAHNCVVPDNYDGGCNTIPPHFLAPTLTLPGTVYGESGTFQAPDPNNPNTLGQYRDLDWYQVSSAAPAQIFTVTIRAEFNPRVWVVHAGSDNLCLNTWNVDASQAGTKCTDFHFVTHCLPAGKYYFIVAPDGFSGVTCGADYQLTVTSNACTPYQITCTTPNHTEASLCNDISDPNAPGYVPDANGGGCPTDPNEVFDLTKYELITPVFFTDYVLCGTTWANEGARDIDYYRFTFNSRFMLKWVVDTELPIRATILFDGSVSGIQNPPTCTSQYYWAQTLATPGTLFTWDHTEYLYQPGTYWFLVAPEDASGAVFYGYPCALGNTLHKYKITLRANAWACPNACTDPGFQPNLSEPSEACPNTGVDAIDGGCDAGAPYHTLPIVIDTALAFDYCAHTGGWFTDPNDPNTFHRDYDWYEFTTDPNGVTNGRWYIYLYGSAPMTWEVWPANNCAAGPIEGLDMPPCYYSAVQPAQCYPKATTYWLRVYPTDITVACQDPYYLAMYNWSGCSVCNPNCGGVSNPDNPCDDVNDFDTNAGCNGNPVNPNDFMTFTVGSTYCGQTYAKVYPNGNGYYDPDWFKFTWPTTTNIRVKLWNTFPAFVAIWDAGSDPNHPCVHVDATNPPKSYQDSAKGWKNWVKTCSGTTAQFLDVTALPAGNYVGAVWPTDFFGNVLTNYYPCTSGRNQYKIQIITN